MQCIQGSSEQVGSSPIQPLFKSNASAIAAAAKELEASIKIGSKKLISNIACGRALISSLVNHLLAKTKQVVAFFREALLQL